MGNVRHIQYGDFFWSYGRAPGKVPIYYGPHIASRAKKRRRSAEFGADDSACRIGTLLIFGLSTYQKVNYSIDII
jgi:hypothetical protein